MGVFDILQEFFYSLQVEETILLAILGLLIFTIGLVLGWIIQYGRTKRYRKQAMLLQRERDEYEVLHRTADEQRQKLAQELEKTSREKVDLMDRIQGKDQEVVALQTQVTGLNARISELELLETPAGPDEESLRELEALRQENEQLRELLAKRVPVASVGNTPPSTPASDGNLSAYLEAIDARFQAFEARLDELDSDTSSVDLDQVGEPEMITDNYVPVFREPVALDEDGDPLVIHADTSEPSVVVSDLGELGLRGDDLTKINSIGTFLQSQLNDADIYTYEQIANWTAADIATYTEMIKYVPGAIDAQDWVGQARKLVEADKAGAEAEPKIAEITKMEKSTSAPTTSLNDLKVVEGIGPKIESVLREAGIGSLDQLATTTPTHLREVLVSANKRYKGQNPDTWPEQAALARDGKWDELSALQQRLDGGKLK